MKPDWLLRWFNPRPALLGPDAEDRERFYALARYPDETEPGEIELASGRDFSQRLFFSQPRSDVAHGTWHFDGMPHRVLMTDRLRMPPGTGHLTGETRKGDAINTLFDQMPEDTLMCLTMVATPQDEFLPVAGRHLVKARVWQSRGRLGVAVQVIADASVLDAVPRGDETLEAEFSDRLATYGGLSRRRHTLSLSFLVSEPFQRINSRMS